MEASSTPKVFNHPAGLRTNRPRKLRPEEDYQSPVSDRVTSLAPLELTPIP